MTGFDILQWAEDEKRRAVQLATEQTQAIAPASYAQADRLSKQTGLDLPTVLRDPDSARSVALQKYLDNRDWADRHPALAESLADMRFVAFARDDMDNLQFTEGTWDWAARAWGAARGSSRRGTIGLVAGYEGREPTNRERAELERIDRRQQEYRDRDPGWIAGAINLLSSSTDSLVAGVAATAATAPVSGPLAPIAGGVAAFTQSFRIEAGNLYLDLLQNGSTPEEARRLAGSFGAAIAAVDLVGLKAGTAPFREALKAATPSLFARGLAQQTRARAFGGAVRSYATAVFGEAGTEAVQEALAILAERQANGGVIADPELAWQRVGEAFTETAKGMAVLGAFGASGHLAADLRRAAAAEQNARVLNQIDATREGSQLAELSPEERAKFVNKAAEGSGGEIVYVRGDQFADVLRQLDDQEVQDEGRGFTLEELKRKVPGIEERIAEAVRTGGDVTIPVGQWDALFARTPLGDQLKQHATFDPDQMTRAEAAAFADRRQEEVEGARMAVARDEADAAMWQASADAVQQRIYGEIKEAAGERLTAREAQASASVYRAFVTTQAERLGMTPGEFDARYPLKVVAGALTPQDLQAGGGRGGFSASRLAVILTQDVDASTFLHEASHYFRHVYFDVASREGAPDTIRQDTEALLKWFGVESLEAWDRMSLEERRPHEEALSYNFERYAFEGMAPSLELSGLFQRIATFVRRVYRSIKGRIADLYRQETGQELPLLTGEVRQVLDRMLAAEEEVTRAEQVRSMMAAFDAQEQSGMSDEEWAAYQQQQRAAHDQAVEELSQASLRDMQWLSRARGRVLQELQARATEARKKARAQAADEIIAEPVHRARLWLRTGRMTDEQGQLVGEDADANHKLATEAVQWMVEPGTDTQKLRAVLAKDGVHPDRVARQFGYRTGKDLVEDLLTAPSKADALDRRTDAIMLAEHSELVDPAQMELAVQIALHNEARERFVASQLRATAGVATPTAELTAAAREAARDILSRRKVGELRPHEFAAAESRAARQAHRLAVAGDIEGATEAMRRQLLNGQLAKQAAQAQLQVEKDTRELRRFYAPDKDLAKTRDTNVLQVLRSLLSIWGLGRSPGRTPLDWLNIAARQDPETLSRFSTMLAAAQDRRNAVERSENQWRDLTLREWTDLMELSESLWHESRRVRNVTLNGRRQDIEVAAGRIVDQVQPNLPSLPEIRKPNGPLETVKNWIAGYLANATRIEHLFLRLDGGKPGPLTAVFRRVKGAGDRYRAQLRTTLEAYEAILKGHDFGPRFQIDATRELGRVFRDKLELIGYLRHIGNQSNKNKLVVGLGWGEWIEGEANADSTRLDAFVKRAVEAGILTKADFDFLQAIWDLNESMKGQAQDAHYRNFGFYFKEVEAKPFTVRFPDGTSQSYRGGYVPARIDTKEDPAAARREIDSLAEFHKVMPAVPKGFTMSRLEQYARPLSADLYEGAGHIAQVLRFVHLQEATSDASRILRRREVEQVLVRVNPSIFSQVIDPWLQRSTLQAASRPGESVTEQMIGGLSRSANMGVMFGNLSNALQGLTGLIEATTHVRPTHLLAALASYRGRSSQQAVGERSSYMREHLGRQAFDVQGQLRLISERTGPIGTAKQWASRNAFFLQRFFQNIVDVSVWQGAYNQAVAELTPLRGLASAEMEAVERADAAVRLTQNATDPEDVSSWEYAGPIVKALFPFQSWFVRLGNNIGFRGASAHTWAERMTVYVAGLVLPAVLARVIAEGLAGRLADEDDDGWGDDIASLSLRAVVGTATSALPLVGRGVQLGIDTLFDDEVWNDRMPAPPFVQALQRGLQALRDTGRAEASARDVEDLVTLFGNLSGLPVGFIAKRLLYGTGVAEGRIVPRGDFDYVRGLLTGQTPRETRR